MAEFKRSSLREQGLTDEQVSSVMSLHLGVTDALKEKIHALETELKQEKADSKNVADIQKQLKDAQAENATLKSENDRLKKVETDFTAYKTEQESKETKTAKEKAYRELLKDLEMSDKGIAKAVKYADFDSIELDDKGKLKGAKDLKKTISDEWGDYLPTVTEERADVTTPENTTSGKKTMTKAEIMKIEDDTERQNAIAENHELFGF